MATVKAWAVLEPKGKLQPFTYETGPLAPEQVEIKVEHCGICHTDLGFIANDVGLTTFPLVPGHEITGTVVAMGDVAATKGLSIGQKVGVGWFISSCGHCDPCLNGDQNLCVNSQAAIWGNHGGWAEKIRANWIWTIPIPVSVLLLLIGQRSLSSSLAGSRGVVDKMLRFAAQHHIAPITEHFPMSKVNEAIEKIESGKAAYRVVLDADF